MKVEKNALKMYLSYGEEIEGNLIPYYLLRDWRECTIDGNSLLSIRLFCEKLDEKEESNVYQYYITPIMYALMTEQYELAKQLLDKGCDTFFWQKNTYQRVDDSRKDGTFPQVHMELPCFLLLNRKIPKELRRILWEHVDDEMNDRDQPTFVNIQKMRQNVPPFGLPQISESAAWSAARENTFIRNISDLIHHHPRIASKLEGGLYRMRMSLESRMQLHKMLAPLYKDDPMKQSGLFILFQIDEDDVSGAQPCTRRHESLRAFCRKYDGIEKILEYFEYISQFCLGNQSSRQVFFENLIVNLTWLEEVATVSECNTIEAFAKRFYEPTCRIDAVSLHCLESNSFEFLQRSNLYSKCVDRLIDFQVEGEIARDYIEDAVRIIDGPDCNEKYRNGFTGEQMFKRWLNHFNSIQYHNPYSLPFSLERLFESRDRELVVMAIRKGLLPKERCEEYIAYCLEEHCMEYIPFLLYLRSELYFGEGAG